MPETIEAEVIEIDGRVPPQVAARDETAGAGSSRFRAGMRGAVLNLDRRWWPLWVLLGVVAVVLAATVGVVLGACYLTLSLIRVFFRGLFGGISGGGSGSGGLRRR